MFYFIFILLFLYVVSLVWILKKPKNRRKEVSLLPLALNIVAVMLLLLCATVSSCWVAFHGG